ncbi:MAG: MmcB family DNA repair protein [Candidatus Magnetobacterium sp. LHC-1]
MKYNDKCVQASDVRKALAKRHTITNNDFFMTEVRTGASWTATYFIIDVVAIRKSWTKPCTTAYEVKVNRGDFLRDQKWQRYLEYCNEMYFACPNNLIKPEELPAEVGLVYVGESGSLRTIRKAAYRTIDIPKEFYIHIIFSHMQADRIPFYSEKVEYFKDWMANKKTTQELAINVKSNLIKELREKESNLEKLKDADDRFNKIVRILKENGIDFYHFSSLDYDLKKLKESKESFDKPKLRNLIHQLNSIVNQLENV